MPRPTLAFALTLVLGFAAEWVVGWWGLGAVAFAVALSLTTGRAWASALLAALAGALVWGLGALWFGAGGGDLPTQVGELFGFGGGTGIGLAVVAVAALWSGLSAYTGALLRLVVAPPSA